VNGWLLKYGYDITSQSGQDGIINKIFSVLDIEKGLCVDVGASGYKWSNVYSLIVKKGWGAVLIECDYNKHKRLRKMYRNYRRRGIVTCINVHVELTGENTIDQLLNKVNAPKDFDFLNIDIDGKDYSVWESLKEYQPKIVDIEFGAVSEGASLIETEILGKSKGYELTCVTENNAFFVRQDMFGRLCEEGK
jgi:hypothetical protein